MFESSPTTFSTRLKKAAGSVLPSALFTVAMAITATGHASTGDDVADYLSDPSTIRTGAEALAGYAPPPLDTAGSMLIEGLWPEVDSTEVMLNELNDKLDSIQGSLGSIQDTLSTLRSDIRSDFEAFFADRTYKNIQATIEHVAFKMTTDYTNAVGSRTMDGLELTGLSSEYLNGYYLYDLETMLAESIDYFLFDSGLGAQYKMTTAADFLLMSELHLMVLQEQIELFKLSGYICLADEVCQPRESMLETFINTYYDRVDLYTDHLELLGATIKDYRMAQISIDVEPELVQGCGRGPNGECHLIWERTGYYFYRIKDHAISDGYVDEQKKFNGLEEADDEYAAQVLADYNAQVESEVDAMLEFELYGATDDLKASKSQYRYIDGVVAQGCAVLFLDTAFAGDSRVLCSDATISALDKVTYTIPGIPVFGIPDTSFTLPTLGDDWPANISSFILGQNTELTLYSDESFLGESATWSGKQSIDLQGFALDDEAESLRFNNQTD